MTPERKFELRSRQWSVQRFDKPFIPHEAATNDVHEMLDEIERLEGLVTEFYNAYVSLGNRLGVPGVLRPLDEILRGES